MRRGPCLAPSFGQVPAWADGKTEGHGLCPTKEHFLYSKLKSFGRDYMVFLNKLVPLFFFRRRLHCQFESGGHRLNFITRLS